MLRNDEPHVSDFAKGGAASGSLGRRDWLPVIWRVRVGRQWLALFVESFLYISRLSLMLLLCISVYNPLDLAVRSMFGFGKNFSHCYLVYFRRRTRRQHSVFLVIAQDARPSHFPPPISHPRTSSDLAAR